VSVTERVATRAALRPWGWAALAAAAWAGLFAANELVWDGLFFDLLGWEGRVGSAVHFFFYDTGRSCCCSPRWYSPRPCCVVSSRRSGPGLSWGSKARPGEPGGGRVGGGHPFCSCSAVPLFIGFVSAGVPLGITFSFLIASPMVNEVAVVLLWGTFGWRVAVVYLGFGLVIAVVAGWVVGRLRLERWSSRSSTRCRLLRRPKGAPVLGRAIRHRPGRGAHDPGARVALPDRRHRGGRRHPRLGPGGLLRPLRRAGQPLAVPVAVLLGIPLYSNAAGVIPLIEALAAKGLALGRCSPSPWRWSLCRCPR